MFTYNNLTDIAKALYNAGKWLKSTRGEELLSRELLSRKAEEIGGYTPGTIIPSDYCYNRINRDAVSFQYCMFEYVERNAYKFLGLNYPYSGPVYWKPIKEKERIVGHWKEGRLMLIEDPRK